MNCFNPVKSPPDYPNFRIGHVPFRDDVIKWKHSPRYWPFVRWIHRLRWIPLTKASDTELWCFLWSASWINGWVNSREAGDLRRHGTHYEVIVMNLLFVNIYVQCYSYKSNCLSKAKHILPTYEFLRIVLEKLHSQLKRSDQSSREIHVVKKCFTLSDT